MSVSESLDLALTSLNIKQFRGVPKDLHLECGRITILGGSNGLGKTTIFDAIDWALFGDAWRLGQDGETALFNLWSPGRPQIDLFFGATRLTRTRETAVFQDTRYSPSEHLVRDASVFDRPSDIPDIVRRCVYLAQEELRDLIKGPQDRRSSIIAALSGIPFVERFERNVENTLRDIAVRRRRDEENIGVVRARRTELEERRRLFLTQQEALTIERLRAATHFAVELPTRTSAALAFMLSRIRTTESEIRELQGRGDSATRLTTQLPHLSDLRARLAAQHQRVEAELAAIIAVQTATLQELDDLSKAHARALDDRKRAEQTEATLVATQREVTLQRAASDQRVLLETERLQLESERTSLLVARAESAVERDLLEGRLSDERRRLVEAAASASVQTRMLGVLEERQVLSRRRAERAVVLEDAIARAAVARSEAAFEHEVANRTAEVLRNARLRGDAHARLGAALLEIRRAVSSGVELREAGCCPLCGHKHTSTEELLESIRAMGDVVESVSADGVMKAAMEAAESAASRATKAAQSLELIEAEVRAIELDLKTCEASLGALPEVTITVSEDRLAQVNAEQAAGRARVEDLERTVAENTANDLVRSARKKQLEERLQRTTALLDSGTGSAAVIVRAVDEDGLQAQLTETRVRLERVMADVAARQRALSEMRNRAEEFSQRRASLESERRRTEADLAVVNADEQKALGEAGGLLPASAPDDVPQLLDQLARECGQAVEVRAGWIAEAKEMVSRIESAAGSDELPEIESEIQSLAQENERLEQGASGLQLAHKVLDNIRSRVRAEVENEGQLARRRFQRAIDSILSGLSPYRHLNRVVMDEQGSLGLNDARLNRVVEPHLYSSTGQLNCAALAIFLGLSVTATLDRIGFIMLDEPVQNLDDVNILNFIDVVRRVAKSKQVFISTADRNLFLLLKKKLTVWARAESQRVLFHDFREFSRDEGPIVVSQAAGDDEGRSATISSASGVG